VVELAFSFYELKNLLVYLKDLLEHRVDVACGVDVELRHDAIFVSLPGPLKPGIQKTEFLDCFQNLFRYYNTTLVVFLRCKYDILGKAGQLQIHFLQLMHD
jgi:hypothetical protein